MSPSPFKSYLYYLIQNLNRKERKKYIILAWMKSIIQECDQFNISIGRFVVEHVNLVAAYNIIYMMM
jgi:hypothetical protein